jgi:hypothetical protein
MQNSPVGTIVALLLLMACAEGAPLRAPARQGPRPPWTLSLEVSGGFVGLDRRLDLASDGAATASDRRRQIVRKLRATDTELKTIGALVATARPLDARSKECRDCFQYELQLLSGRDTIVIRSDDVGLRGTDAEQLITALSRLLDRALAGDAP